MIHCANRGYQGTRLTKAGILRALAVDVFTILGEFCSS